MAPDPPHPAAATGPVEPRLAAGQGRALLDLLPLVTYMDTLEAGTSPLFMSPQIEQLLGYPADEVVGHHGRFLELVHPEDRDAVAAWMETVEEPGVITHRTYRMLHRDGHEVLVEDGAMHAPDPGSGRMLVYGYLRDVTESARAAEELARSTSTTQAILDSAIDAIMTADAEGLITGFSRSAERMFGYTREEAMGRRLGDLVVPEDMRAAHQAGMERLRAGGEPRLLDTVVEVEARRRDGTRFPVEVFITRIEDPDGASYAGFVRDISERLAAQEALRRSEERFRAITESAPDLLATTDEQGTVTFISESVQRLLGRPPEHVVGRPAADFLPPERQEAALAEFGRLLAEPGFEHSDVVALRRADGVYRLFEVTAHDHRDDDAVGGIIVAARDITERRQVEADLALARDEALRAARVKTDFLASMSHEIRTPMNGILATAELLRGSGGLDEEAHKLAGIMLDSARALSHILDDVLDFSRIDAGQLDHELVPFDLAEVVQGAVELLVPAGRAKGVEVHAELDPEMPTRLLGEAGWLRQIVLNLAGNAVKFTDEGEVVVHADVQPGQTPRSVQVSVSVRDTGPGIAAEDVPRLFAPFVQADSSIRRRHGGTGLGLAITRQLCEAMGGSVDVDSTPGQGSTFTVHLPFTLADRAVAPAPEAVPPLEHLEGARVLVVEDNEFNREIVVRQLTVLGADPTAVAEGVEAVAAIVTSPWDCVLMDCHMPGMDGFQTTRAVRALPLPGHDTPIVALTASALESDREACLAAGMNDHLAKPLTLEALRAMLERWVPAERTPRTAPPSAGEPVAAPAPPAAPAAPAPAPVAVPPAMLDAVSRLRSDLGPGPDGADGLVELFLGELDARLEAMDEALAAQDTESLERVAHTMRSIAATLGAEPLADLCQELERSAHSGGPERADLIARIAAESQVVRDALHQAWGVAD